MISIFALIIATILLVQIIALGAYEQAKRNALPFPTIFLFLTLTGIIVSIIYIPVLGSVSFSISESSLFDSVQEFLGIEIEETESTGGSQGFFQKNRALLLGIIYNIFILSIFTFSVARIYRFVKDYRAERSSVIS